MSLSDVRIGGYFQSNQRKRRVSDLSLLQVPNLRNLVRASSQREAGRLLKYNGVVSKGFSALETESPSQRGLGAE